jgi:Domain of unknown function (DUF4432)
MEMSDDGLLRLVSDRIAVAIWPGKGADILELVDRRTGHNLLWKPPWGRRTLSSQPFAGNSSDYWIQRYAGGWNLLLPHAGTERNEAGATWGFHGEASLISWEVEDATNSHAVLHTTLQSAPLSVRRDVRVADDTLSITELVHNDSRETARFSWGHHPSFGAPFLADGLRLEIPARTVQLDTGTATYGLGAEGEAVVRSGEQVEVGHWPTVAGVDLSRVPAESDGPRALLAYLGNLDDGAYRLINDKLELGFELRWPRAVFPWVWLWQEMRGTPGFPWFRRVYTMAVEPQSTAPEGGPPTVQLQGGDDVEVTLSARVFSTAR